MPAEALAVTAAAAAAPAQAAGPSLFELVFPLTILLILATAIPIALLTINKLASRWIHGTENKMQGKNETYECGLPSTLGTANEQFSVKFYLIAMLFLVFDIEVAFLYAWAWQFNAGGWGMVGILVAFLVLLEVGYLYLWKKGALDWEK